jgi:hypothetical protein
MMRASIYFATMQYDDAQWNRNRRYIERHLGLVATRVSSPVAADHAMSVESPLKEALSTP